MFVALHEILIPSGLQSLILNAVGQKYLPVLVESSGGGLFRSDNGLSGARGEAVFARADDPSRDSSYCLSSCLRYGLWV